MTDYTTNPAIHKVAPAVYEESPFVFNGDLYKAGFVRGWTSSVGASIMISKYDPVADRFNNIANIPWTRLMGCVLSDNGHIYAFGSSDISASGNKIIQQEIDPATWTFRGAETVVVQASGAVKFYNSSVTKGPDKYIMAYETNEATPFSLRFVQSTDLVHWNSIGALCNANFYSACPCVKYGADGWYMLAYMWNNNGVYETAIARTNDFVNINTFQGVPGVYTAYQQLLSPDAQEGINNSDVDWTEWNGKIFFVYLVGDQSTWGRQSEAWFNGTMIDLYHNFWPA